MINYRLLAYLYIGYGYYDIVLYSLQYHILKGFDNMVNNTFLFLLVIMMI